MIAIETIATVTPDGKVTVQLPSTIPSGEHKLILVIDETPVEREKRPPLDFSLQQKEEMDFNQYAGVIKLAQDPLEYQQQIRDEWR